MRRAKAWLLLSSLVALIGAPLFVFGVYLPRFITADTALAGVPRSRSTLPVRPPAGRVVVIVIDGLGYDVGLAAPELAAVRRRGVTRSIRVPFPSFTSPMLVAFMTGLGPRDSGVRLNGPAAHALAPLDNLSAVALDASRRLTLFDDGWEPFAELLMAPDDRVVHGELATVLAPYLERGFIEPRPGDIDIVYFLDVDTQGHKHGAESPEYRDAVARAARAVERHAAVLDGSRDVLVVLSDHGHLPDGGHGGTEPSMLQAFFLAVGPELRRDVVLDSCPVEDVAPTLALFAGLTPPAVNLGRPMLDALDVDERERARRLAAPFDESARLLCALAAHAECSSVPTVAARLVEGDGSAVDAAIALLDALVAAREEAEAARVFSARWLRVGVLLVALVALALLLRRRVRLVWASAAAPLALLTVATLALALDGYRVTFSEMPGRDVFLGDAVVAFGCGAVAAFAVGFFMRRAHEAAAMVLAGTAVPFVVLATYVGIDAASVVPPYAGLLVLLGAPALPAAAVAAMVLALFGRNRVSEPASSGAGAPA